MVEMLCKRKKEKIKTECSESIMKMLCAITSSILVLFSFSLLVNSQTVLLSPRNNGDDLAAPTPYQFSYVAPAIGGGSSHQETGDEYGRKTGSYTIEDEDGRSRTVEYVADENGFRVSISTNEPGTANQNPADVTISSSAEDGAQTLGIAAPQVIPVAPAPIATPVARIAAQPIPIRRQAFQPTLVPIQPAVVPIQPAFVPFDNRRLVPQPSLVPFAGGQPALIPIDAANQPAFVAFPNNANQFGGLVLQPF